MAVDVFLGDVLIGRTSQFQGGSLFEYCGGAWDLGFEPAPILMPLGRSVMEFHDAKFEGLPPMLADSLPDQFGQRIMHDWFSQKGIYHPSIEQKLSYIGKSGMGALRYQPASESDPSQFSLGEVVAQAQRFIDNKPIDLESFRRKAGTPGGAYPKVLACRKLDGTLTEFSGELPEVAGTSFWLVKLSPGGEARPHLQQFGHYPQVEFAYLKMAEEAGIHVPRSELWQSVDQSGVTHRHLAVERFDFSEGGPVHTQTYAALTGIYPGHEARADYIDLMERTRQLTGNIADCIELFRRAVFNVLSENSDDHTKNFSFQAIDRQWRLSPVYDLGYIDTGVDSRSPRAMAVLGDSLYVKTSSLIKLADAAGMSHGDALSEISRQQDVLSGARGHLKEAGCRQEVVDRICRRIDDNIQRSGKISVSISRDANISSDDPEI